MHAIKLGPSSSATLIIISWTELQNLADKHRKGAIALLEGGENAPGVAVLVESDRDHNDRLKPGETRKTLKRFSGKNHKNTPPKNGARTDPAPVTG